LTGKDNQSQTGIINLWWLFFSWTTQERYDFVAIDHNDNVTKETVNLSIQIPNIEVIDLKKTWEKTAEIIAKISNDLDEWTVIFQRLRNGIRKNMDWTEANQYSWFGLLPKQTIITGGIFTIGNDIGLYDTKGNELATIDPKTGEIQINQGYKNTVKLRINLNSHIPVVELVDIARNVALFQIVLPLEGVTIQMDWKSPYYEQIHLTEGDFGDFDNGYCIKNINNECILYTNNAWAIYIPGEYASSLAGEYLFDTTIQKPKFIIKDQSGNSITTLILQFRASQ
jgi:hypothetical protein